MPNWKVSNLHSGVGGGEGGGGGNGGGGGRLLVSSERYCVWALTYSSMSSMAMPTPSDKVWPGGSVGVILYKFEPNVCVQLADWALLSCDGW